MIDADESEARRRRLLVALDAADDAQLLLDAAADMAARMHADLAGLFIEDMDLLGLGDNPLIRMVSAHAAAAQSIATREIERALRRQVATAREAFERAAKARRLESSFEVRRGRLASALQGEIEIDWNEVRRLAQTNNYDNWKHVQELTHEQAKAFKVRSPYNPDA